MYTWSLHTALDSVLGIISTPLPMPRPYSPDHVQTVSAHVRSQVRPPLWRRSDNGHHCYRNAAKMLLNHHCGPIMIAAKPDSCRWAEGVFEVFEVERLAVLSKYYLRCLSNGAYLTYDGYALSMYGIKCTHIVRSTHHVTNGKKIIISSLGAS